MLLQVSTVAATPCIAQSVFWSQGHMSRESQVQFRVFGDGD